MDCVVTPLKTLMGFSVHLNVQLKFYNLPNRNIVNLFILKIYRKNLSKNHRQFYSSITIKI
ncbi:hypothetical protein EFP05_13300 [Lactiplantibacillus pentosus]|nr:hypothetical protein [Lactiplantibacillus pentosus]